MRFGSRWALSCLLGLLGALGAGQASAENVRVACPKAIPLYYLPVPIAHELGLFKKEGLDVEVVDLIGANAAKALIAGSVEFSCNSLDHAIKALGQGQSLKMVAGFQRLPGLALVVAAALKDNVKSIEDLKGRAIGVGVVGSSTHLSLLYLLKKAGMSEQDVKVVSLPGPPFVAAIKAGRVEAGMNLEPYITKLLNSGDVTLLRDLRTRAGTKEAIGTDEFLNTGVITTRVQIENAPETVQKFVNAIVAANVWIAAHGPEEIADAMPDLGDLRPDFLAAMATLKEAYYEDAVPTMAGVEAAVEFHRAIGTVEAGSNLDLDQLVDLSFVEKAVKQ